MSLEAALKAHCEKPLMAASAPVEGIETLGFLDASDSTLGGILDVVKDWLKEAKLVPPKEDVVTYVLHAFDLYIATKPPLKGRPFLTRMARQGLRTLVEQAYDLVLE